MLNTWLADRTGRFTITSPAADVIRLSADGKASDVTLDPISFLPVKSRSVSLADPDHPSHSEADTLARIKVQGVSFPARIRNVSSGDGFAEGTTNKSS
jgi:hypothetical protein